LTLKREEELALEILLLLAQLSRRIEELERLTGEG
jgi:hypothetical protein